MPKNKHRSLGGVELATIRAELARNGLTQTALAANLGMSQASLSSRLTGHVAFSVPEIQATAKFLGIRVTDLIAEEVAS